MNINIKTEEEIAKMRIAGECAAKVLEMIEPYIKAGVSTLELNDICHNYIISMDAIPAPLNYRGFPKSICTSPNHVVCHGIPSASKILKNGDILNIDITVIKNGYHGDTSKMFFIGTPSVKAKRLVTVTQECLYLGIKQVKPGNTLKDIALVIQMYAEDAGYSVVREYCGHGIGEFFHEDPQVLHYVDNCIDNAVTLKPGMIFTIEPMINEGKAQIKIKPDNWTVVTKDHKLSAQWEHTILVTTTGYEVLTKRQEEDGLI
jgi:methionyl aminopeptidase